MKYPMVRIYLCFITLCFLAGFGCEINKRRPEPLVLTLEWEMPTHRENGVPLAPGEVQLYTVYEDGEPMVATSGMSSQVLRPKSGCRKYTVTATDNDGLESRHSESVEVCDD